MFRQEGCGPDVADRVAALVALLIDPNARADERDDAGSLLEQFESEAAVGALARIASSRVEDTVLVETCGESLAGVWARRGAMDPEAFEALHPMARAVVVAVLRARAPRLLGLETLRPQE